MFSNSSGADQPAGCLHRVGELLARRGGRRADLPGGCLEVLLLDGRDDVGGSEAERGEAIRTEPDPHPVLGAAIQIHLRDPGHAEQGVPDVDHGVVVEELGVAAPLGRVERDHHQDAGVDLLDRDPLLGHLQRQSRLGLGHPVLGQDVRHVPVHAHLERHVQQHAAVAGVERLHVDHVVHAVDLLLDRRGHRLLDHLRGRALVGGFDPDGRRRQLGILLDGQPLEHRQAEQGDDDRRDDGDDGPPDEEISHGSCSGGGVWRWGFGGGGTYLDAVAHLLQPLDHDPVGGLEALGHDPIAADSGSRA